MCVCVWGGGGGGGLLVEVCPTTVNVVGIFVKCDTCNNVMYSHSQHVYTTTSCVYCTCSAYLS